MRDHIGMGKQTVQQVLAKNVEALRKAPGMPSSQAAIGKDAGIDQKTVSRILGVKNAPGVDCLDGLAKAFKVEPWQLLVPGLDPIKKPQIADVSPLAMDLARLYDALPMHRRRLLYANAQDMHNPEAPRVNLDDDLEQPVARPTQGPAPGR